MKLFVTGYLGYVGAHLVNILKKQNHFVVGCDLNLYSESYLGTTPKVDSEFNANINTLSIDDLKGIDCVIHLAAISNDPMGELDPRITERVNRDDAFYLAQLAKRAGVSRFIFASSCSIYGESGEDLVDEQGLISPQSVYARTKVEAEKAIGSLADESFSPLYLRNATAYGYSPSLRLDLVANDLLASAVTRKEMRMQSDGTPWRPMIHVEDIARVMAAFLEHPRTCIHNLAVNVGQNHQNMQVIEIVKKVLQIEPEAKFQTAGEILKDRRNYRVNFDLLRRLLPSFQFRHSLDTGLRELKEFFLSKQFHIPDFDSKRFSRLYLLKKKLLENPRVFDPFRRD